MQLVIRTCFAAVVVLCLAGVSRAAGEFKPLFDGKTLDGWQAKDMSYWSVEDGAITAQAAPGEAIPHNQFLIWQGGPVDDFELRLKFRIQGGERANSGIQYRSSVQDDGHLKGYQADIDRAGQWMGALYDEHSPRKVLAKRGQKTVIDNNGNKQTDNVADPAAIMSHIDLDGWNEYHIIARGNHLIHKINGKTTAEVVDHDPSGLDFSGVLALQLHSGPPMKVQFKDIELKRLPLTGDRKKVVMVAGPPSHPSGQHEFNAGVKLLAKRLDKVNDITVAAYHDNGWPKDPTAFDNADAIVLYMDGWKKHPINDHLAEVDALMRRGVGLMCMHYAVHVKKGRHGEYFKQWIGGYYEDGWSSNPHWKADLKPNQSHPITSGVDGAIINDEWYFNMRFRDDRGSVTTILEARPSDKTRSKNGYPPKPYPHIIEMAGRSETLMWAVQRSDGGRGVGFTGGHWHRNWAHPTQLRAVLNAMVWVAGANVPDAGVAFEPVTEKELNENLDKKKKMVHIELPEKLD